MLGLKNDPWRGLLALTTLAIFTCFQIIPHKLGLVVILHVMHRPSLRHLL
jgi:hypothetical protein